MEKPTLPTLRQLQYFKALATEKNFRKASESMGVSQPSLSEQITTLESIVQTPLVERGRRGAVLTASGREVLSRVETILEDVEALMRVARETHAGVSGTYRLGASTTLGPYLLPSVVRRLHARHPELRLYVRDGQPRELLEDLQGGKLDLLLTQLPVHASELEVTRLFREPLRLAVARGHRLSERADTRDADLAGETLLVLSNGYLLHTQLAELASMVGATLRQDYEGSSLDALRQMVAMDMGITMLPALYAESEVKKEDGGVALVPFKSGSVTRSIGLVTRRSSRNPAAFQAFSDAIMQVVRTEFSHLLQPYT